MLACSKTWGTKSWPKPRTRARPSTLASDGPPDLALVDIRLARNTDGGALARRLYTDLGVRSLFVSGSITEDFRRSVAEIEPVGFLGKPVTRRTLGEALRAVQH